MATQKKRDEVVRRLEMASLAGVSTADLTVVGVLFSSLMESIREIGTDSKHALIVGLMIGSGIGSADPGAGRELLTTLRYMLNDHGSFDDMERTTIPLYLKQREMLLGMDLPHA